MNPTIGRITAAHLHELLGWSGGCDVGHCLYWERPELRQAPPAERAAVKAEWFGTVEAEFGCCAAVAAVEGAVVGFAQFAPPQYFPMIRQYASGPPTEGAVFISCLDIAPAWQGKGIGAALLRGVLEELHGRRIPLVETFARVGSAENPSGPWEFWEKQGFVMVRDDPEFPLVGRDLR